jgi:hypothetical protein
MFTIGFGRNSVSSLKRVPSPPQSMTVFICTSYISVPDLFFSISEFITAVF